MEPRDRVTELLVETLAAALARPGEHRLYRSGKLEGLFPNRNAVAVEGAGRATQLGEECREGLRETQIDGAVIDLIEDRLQFPIVVKPAGQGSALGIKFARTPADVPQAVLAAVGAREAGLIERGARAPDPIARVTSALAGKRQRFAVPDDEGDGRILLHPAAPAI